MIVIAHRGASAYEKENTLKAFKKAFDLNARYLETDIQRTAEGKLILYHDYFLPDGKAVKDCTFAYLKRFNVPQDLFINLEIKNDGNIYPQIETQLFDFLNSSPSINKERLLISSFDFDTLKRVRALDGKIKIGVLTRDFDITKPLELKAFSVNISHTRLTEDICLVCHKNGLKVLVYTVNDTALAKEVSAKGADGIFSDYPDLLNESFKLTPHI